MKQWKSEILAASLRHIRSAPHLHRAPLPCAVFPVAQTSRAHTAAIRRLSSYPQRAPEVSASFTTEDRLARVWFCGRVTTSISDCVGSELGKACIGLAIVAALYYAWNHGLRILQYWRKGGACKVFGIDQRRAAEILPFDFLIRWIERPSAPVPVTTSACRTSKPQHRSKLRLSQVRRNHHTRQWPIRIGDNRSHTAAGCQPYYTICKGSTRSGRRAWARTSAKSTTTTATKSTLQDNNFAKKRKSNRIMQNNKQSMESVGNRIKHGNQLKDIKHKWQ